MSRKHADRVGFTLIELLMVILILSILMGLVTAGVMKFVGKGPEIANANDINQLATAVEAFKTRFGSYPPSTLKLSNKDTDLDAASLSFLMKLFPQLDFSLSPDWSGGTAGVTWPVTLTGDQVMVFCLGGMPVSGGFDGFSTNPKNPTAAGGNRIGPFYDFKTERLAQKANKFYSYLDYYREQPFLYFSTGVRPNTYSGSITVGSTTITPYGEGTRAYNPNSFQIISAGVDKVFGPGGAWKSSPAYNEGGAGFDDQTNFISGQLGGSK